MPRVWDVPVLDPTRVRDARVAAEGAAALAGLDERRTAAAALVATELATNLLKHAEGGQVLIDVVAPPAPRGEESRVVQIAAIDHGPGIADVPAAVRDGFSTTRSLGAGLGTCLRLADDFGLHTTPGRGTVAVARVGTTPRGNGAPAGPRVRVWADGVSGSWDHAPGPGGPAGAGHDGSGSGQWPGGAPPFGAVPCGGPTRHTGPAGHCPAGSAVPSAADARLAPAAPGLHGIGAAEPGPLTDASQDRSLPLASVRAGGVNIPYGGAEYSGDAWAWVRSGDLVTLMLADGLGHGPEAARASSTAVTTLHRWAGLSPAESLGRLHDALKGTRGAAVSLAQLDLSAGRLRFAGIGNVGARLRTGGTWRALLARPGIVGVHRPATFREVEADWTEDALLILHTDGLPSRWTPPSGPGLPMADPAVTAAVTIRDASSPARPVRDDTAVAVLTSTPPERP
jgi:anti-sigma regulatory factor (Ser/Thr protein kinase)